MLRKLSEEIKMDFGTAISSFPLTLNNSSNTPIYVEVGKYNRVMFAVRTYTRSASASLTCQPKIASDAGGTGALSLGSATTIITGSALTLIDVDTSGIPYADYAANGTVTLNYIGLLVTETTTANFIVQSIDVIRAPARYNQASLPS
jgi:hypothetical protein